MSAGAGFVRAWRVGRYRATLTAPRPRAGQVAAAVIEWEPAVPQRLSPAERDEYRAGRDAALRDLASEFGISVGVLEL